MRHGNATAVVGQGNVFVAPRLRCGCHSGDGNRAVGPVRVHVKVAPNIGEIHKLRQLAGLGSRDLTAILAQFRFNECKPELLVDLFLRGAGNPPFSRKQPIFVQLPAMLVGKPAQRNVVSFGTGEIQQRGAIAFLRHRADIDLQAGAKHHGGARRAMRGNLRDVFVLHQPGSDRGTIPRGHQHIKVADRVAAPAITSGDHDASATAKKSDQRVGLGFSH